MIFRWLIFCAVLIPSVVQAWDWNGNLNTWTFYQTDDVSSTTVAIVKDANGNTLGVVVGADIAVECATQGRTCEYRTIGEGTELELQRVTDSGREDPGKVGGDTLLWNLGLNAKGTHKKYSGKFNGNATFSLLDNRSLAYGKDRARFRVSEAYAEINETRYHLRFGRQSPADGVLVDGVSGDYFLGPDFAKDAKSVGFFAGLAPDPISKIPSKDFIVFGPRYQWIPNFSHEGSAKLFVDGALITELYKQEMNRFYLISRVRFTPIKSYSSLIYSHLELPWTGRQGSLSSSLFSFQNYWRPSSAWFFELGFTQFKISRYLQEAAVRWVTENNTQETRIGDTLDRSHRYRLDVRASYKPFPFMQPFVRARYERRTFDDNKKYLNSDPLTPQQLNLTLLNRKNAYQGTLGLRLFLFDSWETETSGTYGQRFQSKFYTGYQSVYWESPKGWAAMLDGQIVSSSRTQDLSTPNVLGRRENAEDYYVGLMGSYRFMSDILAQIRYDFGNEDDAILAKRITYHSVLARIDYKF